MNILQVQLLLLVLYHVSLGGWLKSDIVGGQNATKEYWPWMVAMFVEHPNANTPKNKEPSVKFQCGGSLISSEWVLTAAHCVQCLDPQQILVYVGIYKIGNRSKHRVHRVKYFVPHEAYAPGIGRNDIALLRLKDAVKGHNFSKLAHIADEFPPQASCMVAGWGQTAENVALKQPGILQQLKVHIVDTKKCKSMFHDTLIVFDERVVCAGTTGKKRNLNGTCKGDSGGPLICAHTKPNTFVQVGVVNQAKECGVGPTIFARVAYFRKWILEKVGRLP